jgi:hypothetical protein
VGPAKTGLVWLIATGLVWLIATGLVWLIATGLVWLIAKGLVWLMLSTSSTWSPKGLDKFVFDLKQVWYG